MLFFCFFHRPDRQQKLIKAIMENQGSRFDHKRKLTLEKEEAIDPLFHLFTQIPLTSFERDPQFFSKNINENNKNQHRASQSSNISLNQNNSVDTCHKFDHLRSRNSINEAEQRLYEVRYKQKKRPHDALRQFRVQNICKNMITKLKRNNIYAAPASEEEIAFTKTQNRCGFALSKGHQLWWGLFSSIIIIMLFISQSLLLAYSQLWGNSLIKTIISLGIAFILGEMVIGLGSIKRQQGRKIVDLVDIMKDYSKRSLIIDITLLAILIVMLTDQLSILNKLFLIVFAFKLPTLPSRLIQLQHIICRNNIIQTYFPVIKLIILNIAIAHIVAILLSLMVIGSHQANWQINKGIEDSWWLQRYTWSLYWSVTIMTTVGFGGIAPISSQEAIWLIFIEIASFIVIAYNLISLGSFITNRSAFGKHKKAFDHILEQKFLSEKLKQKISDYVEGSQNSHLIQKVRGEKQAIQSLPKDLKLQILRESAENSLRLFPFFKQFHQKTISQLSECLQRIVCMPNQAIQVKDGIFNLYALQKGEVGYFGRHFHHPPAHSIKIQKRDRPFLLNLNFLTLQRSNFQIRSMVYSIILLLPFQCFKAILQSYPRDNQYYCFFRDRSKHIIDEYQTIHCTRCPSKHTDFNCPKLHFIPIKQHVIQKHLKTNSDHPHKKSRARIMRRKMNTLSMKNYCEVEYSKMNDFRIGSFEGKKEYQVVTPYPRSILDAMASLNLWKISQASRGENDWSSNLLTLQFSNQLRLREYGFQDEVWLISCDRMHDYGIYFPESNLKAVTKRFNVKSKGEKML